MGKTYETPKWNNLGTREKKIYLFSKEVPEKSDRLLFCDPL